MSAVLVEREHEIQKVDEALRGARAGTGSSVAIAGPLGIGKSALAHASVERGRELGFRVLRASAALHEQDFDFGIVWQLLDPVFNTAPEQTRRWWSEGVADDVHRLLADGWLKGDPHGPTASEESLLHGLYTVVVNMSAELPVLMVIDDLQWADLPSLRWLSYLSRRAEGLPVVVAVTMLDGDPGADRAVVREIRSTATATLRPARLSPPSVRAVVESVFGEQGEPEFVQACLDVSVGNPMFLVAMLQDMRAAGRRPVAAEVEHARSLQPAGLREQVLACLVGQPVTVRNLICASALLGADADAPLLAHAAELDDVQHAEAARVLRKLGLVTAGASPQPIHPAVRAAVAELTTAACIERFHARVAAFVRDQGRPPEEVAAHLVEVVTPLDHHAIGTLRAAAEAALARRAPKTAASYLRRALLDTPADSARRAGLLVELATAERAFDPSAAVRHVSQAVPGLTSTRERAMAAVLLSPMVLAQFPTPVTDLVRNVARELGPPERLSGSERELALRLEARRRYIRIGDPAELTDCVRRLRMLGPNPPLDTPAERELLAVLLHAATVSGEVGAGEVARLANRILEHEPARDAHVHTGLPLLVYSLIGADSLSYLSTWLDRMRSRDSQQDEDHVTRTLVHAETAVALATVGRLKDGLLYARKVIELGGLEWQHGSSVPTMAVATLALETADPELARTLLAETPQQDRTVCVMAALRMLRGVVADGDELGPALQQILDIGQELEHLGRHNPALYPWRSIAATLHHRLGNVEEAHSLIEQEYKLALEWGAPVAIGRALRTYAGFCAAGRDIALLRESAAVLEKSANRVELARTHLVLGRRLRSAGNVEADLHLRRAHSFARECEQWQLVDEINTELRITPSSPEAPDGVLTPTELEVALLARDGRTNQEIADNAQVTRRAVEKHLTKIYRKLGISGRSDLSTALRSPGHDDMAAGEPVRTALSSSAISRFTSS